LKLMKTQLSAKILVQMKTAKTSGFRVPLRRLFVGLMILLVLTVGATFYFSPKAAPHSVLSMVSIKNRIESIIKILGRLENSQDSQQLQEAIDRLLADYLIAEEEQEIKEFDRKAKRQTIPRSTSVD
jgi:hypothetical protein